MKPLRKPTEAERAAVSLTPLADDAGNTYGEQGIKDYLMAYAKLCDEVLSENASTQDGNNQELQSGISGIESGLSAISARVTAAQNKADEASAAAAVAQNTASAGLSKANEAYALASTAKSTAEKSAQDSSAAVSTANQSKITAETALGKANQAYATASGIAKTAQDALFAATQAKSIAESAATVFDPTTGLFGPVSDVISNVFYALNAPISVAELDALNLTVEQLDAYNMTVFEFDTRAKAILTGGNI